MLALCHLELAKRPRDIYLVDQTERYKMGKSRLELAGLIRSLKDGKHARIFAPYLFGLAHRNDRADLPSARGCSPLAGSASRVRNGQPMIQTEVGPLVG